jgi:pimeloyl-ACP methyl ester carboxylesterase
MNGLESFLLRDRLSSAGIAPSEFSYPSMHATLAEVTAALADRLRTFGKGVHLVAHSLGGLVALETLEQHADLPPGRVVLLGSPVQGSRAASAIAGWSLGPQLLGALAVAELARRRERRWCGTREIGLIAGSRSAGLGRVFTELPQPNDGTVCVDETLLPGATAHRVLDVSHTGMLLSRPMAHETCCFLAHGAFESKGGPADG